MSKENQNVYLQLENQVVGPYSWQEVMEMLKKEEVSWETCCRTLENEEWVPLQSMSKVLLKSVSEDSAEALMTRPIEVPKDILDKKKTDS